MEQKLPVITKKLYNLVRAMFFTFNKSISKAKFLATFNKMILKRHKIARKPENRLSKELYEFSCTNTPPYPLSLFSTGRKKPQRNSCHRLANRDLPLAVDDRDDMMIDPAVVKVLSMLTSSPAGRIKTSSMDERRFMMTDSPVPVGRGCEDGQVDDAADKFITRFFNDLRQQDK